MKRIISSIVLLSFGLLGQMPNSFADAPSLSSQDQLNLKFKVYAYDSDTKGVITANTRAVDVGVMMTNDSPYNIDSLKVQPFSTQGVTSPFQITNNPEGPGLDDYLQSSTAGSQCNGQPFSTCIMTFAQNFPFQTVTTKYPITVLLSLTITAHNKALNQNFTFTTEGPAAVVYTPSNTDLIPVILNNLNSIGTTIQNFWSQLTSLQNGENTIINEEGSLYSGEQQLQSGEQYILNDITNQDGAAEANGNTVLKRLK